MKTTDARKLSQQAQFEVYKKVVRLSEKGLDNQAIADIVRLCPSHISTIWKKYERGGLDAIKPGVRDRRHGAQRELTAEQPRPATAHHYRLSEALGLHPRKNRPSVPMSRIPRR